MPFAVWQLYVNIGVNGGHFGSLSKLNYLKIRFSNGVRAKFVFYESSTPSRYDRSRCRHMNAIFVLINKNKTNTNKHLIQCSKYFTTPYLRLYSSTLHDFATYFHYHCHGHMLSNFCPTYHYLIHSLLSGKLNYVSNTCKYSQYFVFFESSNIKRWVNPQILDAFVTIV